MLKHLCGSKFRVIAVLAIIGLATPPARADVLTNESVNFDGFTVFVPCAAGGAGELVVFQGELHILFAATQDASGGFHLKIHFQPQGLTGVGLTTGTKYQATGVTQEEFNAVAGSTYTFVNNFNMIGQGPDNNYMVHENVHVTVNPDGTVTSVVDNFKVDCK